MAKYNFEIKGPQQQTSRPRPPRWVVVLTLFVAWVILLTIAAIALRAFDPGLLDQWTR